VDLDDVDSIANRLGPEDRSGIRAARLKVENVHWDVTEKNIQDLFSEVGKVSKVMIKYDRSGRSEGWAFVTYEDASDAYEAINKYHKSRLGGQEIVVRMDGLVAANSRPRNPQRRRAAEGGRPLASRISGRKVQARESWSGRNRRTEAPSKSQADLDAELERYMSGEKDQKQNVDGDVEMGDL